MKTLLLFLTSASLLTTQAFAVHFNGPTTLENQLREDIVIDGSAKLKNIQADKIVVKGKFDGENILTKSLSVDETDTVADYSVYVRNLKAENVDVQGQKTHIKLENIKVDKIRMIGAKVTMENLFADHLIVNGDLDIKHALITKVLSVTGNLDADNISADNIELDGNSFTINGIQTKNIFVKKDKNNKLQKLIIKNSPSNHPSVIKEDIIFESGKGEVILGEHVSLEGEIKGAVKK